ncbi:MAG: hypothetical protein EOO05_15045, partial [Chitinophagaceae bacterium]
MNWIQRFNTFSFLDNHSYSSGLSTQEVLAGAGKKFSLELDMAPGPEAITSLDEFTSRHKGQWIFGHLAYDFASAIPYQSGKTPSRQGFGDLCFFVPEVLVRLNESDFEISADDPQAVYAEIMATDEERLPMAGTVQPSVQSRLDREGYIATIKRLQEHILRGDCYEINFCQEFYAEDVRIDPVDAYIKLAALSPAPFAALYRVDEQWLACSSPERFIKKTGDRIYS